MARQSGRVLFVSAGMLEPKKRDHPLARRQLYLNYGALTLASLLELEGIPATLVHGRHQDPEEFVKALRNNGYLPSRYPVMLSLPSFYALGWAQRFCRLLKTEWPECSIVAGGRWVTSPDPDWLHNRIPELDRIVPGLAEQTITKILSVKSSRGAASSELPTFPLNHHIVDEFFEFQPSVEISRGCGMRCAFCEERDIPLSNLRAPELVAEFMQITQRQYNGGEIRPYLQSSFFLPNVRWASNLQREVERRALKIQWRCETRVDALLPETIQHLAAAGLKVIDLGLETASPKQIVAMRKSRHIDRYLRCASDLLSACKKNDVWVKINVLLYAGETQQTLSETQRWLDQHADAIKGVSVGPVIVFGPPRQAMPLIEAMEAQGARVVDATAADRTGISSMHLSSEIDADEAEGISLDLSRRYMNDDDYFDLKSFSYYSRYFTRQEFDADVRGSKRETLPFALVTSTV